MTHSLSLFLSFCHSPEGYQKGDDKHRIGLFLEFSVAMARDVLGTRPPSHHSAWYSPVIKAVLRWTLGSFASAVPSSLPELWCQAGPIKCSIKQLCTFVSEHSTRLRRETDFLLQCIEAGKDEYSPTYVRVDSSYSLIIFKAVFYISMY